jgi:hypothetical protein
VLLALVLLSCGGSFESDPPAEPSPWTTGYLPCYSGDGCPEVRCTCVDDLVMPVRGCIDGNCVDDPEAFCSDACAAHGGRANQTAVYRYACEDTADRDACLSCRDTAGRECNADVCAADLDAMMACLADYAPPDIPEGLEYHGWPEPPEEGGDCYVERIAHRNCVLGDCAAFDACSEERDYHPPIARD